MSGFTSHWVRGRLDRVQPLGPSLDRDGGLADDPRAPGSSPQTPILPWIKDLAHGFARELLLARDPRKAAPRAGLGGYGLGGLVLWALGICLGLGTATRLTYHEAFVAQGAREIVASGNWWHPAIGGLPWLEKPPLPFWLVAAVGWCAGEVTPTVARLPSAVAALGLALGVGLLAARRYGSAIGVLAGAVQVTTAWTILRGRLAEADILLACLITWTLLAFDRLRASPALDPGTGTPRSTAGSPGGGPSSACWASRPW